MKTNCSAMAHTSRCGGQGGQGEGSLWISVNLQLGLRCDGERREVVAGARAELWGWRAWQCPRVHHPRAAPGPLPARCVSLIANLLVEIHDDSEEREAHSTWNIFGDKVMK